MKETPFRIFSFAALLCMVLLSACSAADDIQQTPTRHKVSITATQPSTRMGYDSNGTGYWQEGDVIGIWSDTDNKFMPFTLASGAGTATATFTGEMSEDVKQSAIVLYPYSDKMNLDYTALKLSLNLPSTYTYDKVDTDYSQTDGNSFNMPMYALVQKSSDTGECTVEFQNTASVIAVKIERMFSTEGSIVVTSDHYPICGTIELKEGGDTDGFYYGSDASFEVTFNYKNAEIGKSGVFYLPVLPGKYNIQVKVVEKERNNYEYTSATSSFTLEKAHVKRLKVRHDYTTTINGETAVDMGGKVLWAERNIGAKFRADAGNYYAWGETAPKEVYNASTYTYKADEIDAEHDAATVNWGSPWCIPTSEEVERLINSNSYVEETQTNSSGASVNVYKLTNSTFQHYIYVPCVGDLYDSEVLRDWVAEFWSNTRNIVRGSYLMAYIFCIDKDGGRLSSITRNNGVPVRAVVPIHDFKP